MMDDVRRRILLPEESEEEVVRVPELIVEHTVTAEEASNTRFDFLVSDYPALAECKNFMIKVIVENPPEATRPWVRIYVNGVNCKGGPNSTASNARVFWARVEIRNGLAYVRSTGWQNITLAEDQSGNITNEAFLPVAALVESELQKMGLASYKAFLGEGSQILIYGW